MSRVGNLPVSIPDGVKIEIKGDAIAVTGPKGTLTESLRPELDVKIEDNEVIITRPNEQKQTVAALSTKSVARYGARPVLS